MCRCTRLQHIRCGDVHTCILCAWFLMSFCLFVCLFFSMEDSPFGPLTQRLVSAFLEENLMTPMDDIITDLGGMSECVFAHTCVCVCLWGGNGGNTLTTIVSFWHCDMNVSWMSAVLCVTIFSYACSECAPAGNSSSISVLIVCTAFSHKKAHFQDLKKSCCPFLCYGTTRRGKVTYKTLNVTKRKVLLKNKRKKITT